MYLHNWLIHVHAICSSTYMYMKNVNDVTVGYLKLLISRSILSGPLDFEIKRVACTNFTERTSAVGLCGSELLSLLHRIEYKQLWKNKRSAFYLILI